MAVRPPQLQPPVHVDHDANEQRGEVNLTVADPATGEDRLYCLRLSNQAICETQARTGKTWGQLLTAMDSVDYVAYRDVLNIMLRAYHAAEFPNLVAVSKFIDDAGMARINQAMSRLFDLNAADAKAAVAEATAARSGAADPTVATASTGTPPTSGLDATA